MFTDNEKNTANDKEGEEVSTNIDQDNDQTTDQSLEEDGEASKSDAGRRKVKITNR